MRICKKCHSKVVKETGTDLVKKYKYFCPTCDENMFEFETEDFDEEEFKALIKGETMKIDKDRQADILQAVAKALDWQFEGYSWDNMIDDVLELDSFTAREIAWAKENISYKAYILK